MRERGSLTTRKMAFVTLGCRLVAYEAILSIAVIMVVMTCHIFCGHFRVRYWPSQDFLAHELSLRDTPHLPVKVKNVRESKILLRFF